MTQDADEEALVISRVRRMYEDGSARRLREAARLDQSDIARAVGTSRAAVEAWEARRRTPRRDVALRLGGLFDLLERSVAEAAS